MKRRRSGTLTCPFLQCNQTFSTARQLSIHEASHAADKPHQCLECRRRFATLALLDEHAARVHPVSLNFRKGGGDKGKRRRSRGGDDDVLAVDEVDQMEENETQQKGEVEDQAGPEEEEEAREIAENGAYLMSRIKIARSYGIGKWDKKDFQNAYLWATWVQGAVEDFGEGKALGRVLKERGLGVSGLRHAERVLLDSVLGFEGLTSEMLLYMIESVMNADGNGEGEQGGSEEVERRMDGLVAAIVAGIERKRELQRLDGMLCRLNELVDGQNGAQDEKWVRVAKGGILLKRHERMGIQQVREHVRKVAEGGADAEMMAVLVEEMKVAEGVVKTELFEFLGGMLEKEGVRLVRRLDGEMGALCERDVGLFGRYLRLLLIWKRQGSGAGDRDKAIDLIVEGKISIRQAAVERIQKGWVGEEEVRKWINDLIDRRG